ncbi:glycosyltransferase [Lacticaseibacillus paracasei]|uniref:glycosyltransferase n=1 Tax=Lacticaseibacillus paracasei TaxID=1597 RepID=UPI004045AA07
MIFLTVGTHEQGFDRIVAAVDGLVKNHTVEDDVVMQIGYSKVQPKYCSFQQFMSADEMDHYMKIADVVITHGGPSTFIEVLEQGKVPIVVPRLKKYGEHVNDHQLTFCQEVVKAGYPIQIISNLDELPDKIEEVRDKTSTFVRHNQNFNQQLAGLVHKLER